MICRNEECWVLYTGSADQASPKQAGSHVIDTIAPGWVLGLLDRCG